MTSYKWDSLVPGTKLLTRAHQKIGWVKICFELRLLRTYQLSTNIGVLFSETYTNKVKFVGLTRFLNPSANKFFNIYFWFIKSLIFLISVTETPPMRYGGNKTTHLSLVYFHFFFFSFSILIHGHTTTTTIDMPQLVVSCPTGRNGRTHGNWRAVWPLLAS